MINRRARSSINLITLIFLGILAGVVFLIYDNLQINSNPTIDSLTSELLPSPSPFLMTATPQGQLQNTATEVAQVAESYTTINNASIFVPSAGINAPIIRVFIDDSTWDVSTLGMNVGHLQGTSWINDEQPGNIVLSGHVEMRDGRAGIFAPIRDLTIGEIIFLRQGGEERRYVISDIYNVQPDDLQPLYPSTDDRLTLITCDEYDFVRNVYGERTVVVAERLS